MENEQISSDFEAQCVTLEKEIINIELRQAELQNHISDLERANSGLKQIIQKENDPVKKAKYYGAIRNNVELLAKLYSSYKDFESVKFNYRKEISSLMQSKNRIIYIDLPKVGTSAGTGPEEFYSIFKVIAEAMKNDENKKKLIEQVEVEDAQYEL